MSAISSRNVSARRRFAISRDARMIYDGLVDAKRLIASSASSEKNFGADSDMWRYAPPVKTGRVL